MTKLISISLVKNEADIIETWIRYHTRIVDAMVIVDNGSSDGTAEIILSLMQEHLPVLYIFDDAVAYDQDIMTSGLLYAVLHVCGPDFMIPLDADEFIAAETCLDGIRDRLDDALLRECFYQMRWKGYVPTKNDPPAEHQVLRRIMYRRAEEPEPVFKIIIPGEIAALKMVQLKQGNHDVVIEGEDPYERRELPGFCLAHFPVRSVEQLEAKCLVGWLANLARPGHVIFDWIKYYLRIKSGLPFSSDDLTELALRRGISLRTPSPPLVRDPITADIELRHSAGKTSLTLEALLQHCENMARELCLSYSGHKTQKRTVADCEKYYSRQLLNQRLAISLARGGLLPAEAFLISEIVESLSDECRVCVVSDNAEKLSGFVQSLIEEKINGQLITCITGNSRDAQSLLKAAGVPKKMDFVLFGSDHTLESLHSTFNQLTPLIKNRGWIAFHGVTRNSEILEFIEKEISPNAAWNSKRLDRSLFMARKNAKHPLGR